MLKQFFVSLGQKLSSRKLWLAIAVAIFTVFNDYFGWGISDETVLKVILVIGTWIGVEGAADVVSRYACK